MKILALDISTSCVGVCLLDTNMIENQRIVILDRIEFKKCKNIWEKADVVKKHLQHIFQTHNLIDRFCAEEALIGFRPGMSSATTIAQLLRFNGIVSMLTREVFSVEPEYINSAHARKLCGIKLQRTKIGGPQKEQVFKYMSEHDLKHVVWPMTKSGKQVSWSRDATDAYVVAQAASIEGVVT